MANVLEAHRAYKQADLDAQALRARARARLGRAILCRRQTTGATQPAIAKELGVVPEQVRRYEAAWRAWAKEHPDETLDGD